MQSEKVEQAKTGNLFLSKCGGVTQTGLYVKGETRAHSFLISNPVFNHWKLCAVVKNSKI